MAKPRMMFYQDGRHPLIYTYEPPMQKEEYEAAIDEILGSVVSSRSMRPTSAARKPTSTSPRSSTTDAGPLARPLFLDSVSAVESPSLNRLSARMAKRSGRPSRNT